MIAPDVRTHFKPTETFQYYTHFSSCYQQGVKKGFIKGEALQRLLRTNSSKIIFEEKTQITSATERLPRGSH